MIAKAKRTAWIGMCIPLVIGGLIVYGQSRTDPPLSEFSPDRAYEHLQVLAGRIGERAAGTDGESLAVDYISSQFKSWGLDTTVMPVPVPVWHQRRARFWVDGDQFVDFPANAAVFGGVTKADGVMGEFVDIGPASSRDIEGKDLKGKIVLVHRDVYVDYPDVQLTDQLGPMGVAGLVFYSSAGRKGVPVVYFNFKRSLKEPTPPAVVISYEDAIRLARMRPKRVGLTVEADVESKESHTVIGELKGAVKPDQIVVFSAHDDSAYTSPGATDDAGGVAIVMELARVFAKGPRPARTLRFIAWGGHELGLMGSEAYLRKNQNEIDKTVAMIMYDGMGSPLGSLTWSAAGENGWYQFVQGTAKSLGFRENGRRGTGGTDATNFSALEIPSMEMTGAGGHENHTPWDNLDYTSAEGLRDGLLLGAAVANRLGTDTNLTFPHKFPPEILQQVRDLAARFGWGIRPEANLPPRRPN
jgi:hypothetical protein